MDVIGQCPPGTYRDQDPIRNPYYYLYGPGINDEGFDSGSQPSYDLSEDSLEDGGASSSNSLQDDSSPFTLGEGELGTGKDSPLSDFGGNIFASNEDPLFLADSGSFDMSFDPIDVSIGVGDQP